MARIDWAVLCDLAFLDQHDRLCMIGVVRTVPVSRLPLTLHQVTLVARLADIKPVDEVDVAVGIVTPSGLRSGRTGSESVTIEMAREYVLVTLREIPLSEEGVHRFQIRLRGQRVVSIDVPVLAASRSVVAAVQ